MKYISTFIPAIVATMSMFLTGCSSKMPDNLGLKSGRFAQCPQSPNCVSSQATDAEHKINAIKAHGGEDKVMVDLQNAITSMFGAKVVKMEGPYLHAEYTSRVFRFIDDVECYFNEPEGIIEVRSASRIGYSDFSANRKRIEELRAKFNAIN